MAKILWYGDAVSNTGFARVTHSILEHLSKTNEVVVYGINYTGDPHPYPFKIYPAAPHNPADRFGLGRIQSIVENERPDWFICLNDIWIVNQVWERIHLLKHQLKFKFIGMKTNIEFNFILCLCVDIFCDGAASVINFRAKRGVGAFISYCYYTILIRVNKVVGDMVTKKFFSRQSLSEKSGSIAIYALIILDGTS